MGKDYPAKEILRQWEGGFEDESACPLVSVLSFPHKGAQEHWGVYREKVGKERGRRWMSECFGV